MKKIRKIVLRKYKGPAFHSCHFITDRMEQQIWTERKDDGKNKILRFKRKGFEFVMMMMMMTTTWIVFVIVT